MAQASHPSVKPFSYVYIPSSSASSVEERRFVGTSEEDLRATLTGHFRHLLLNEDQRAEMVRHLLDKSKENAGKNDVKQDDATAVGDQSCAVARANHTEASAGGGMQPSEAQQAELIEHYLDAASYEIVPITMPTRQTRFIGTSLYIDDSGAFKSLEMNTRASVLAQREIRGDAFLLSNHDDPALEEWERVNCTLADYEALHRNPPKIRYDASDRAQMAQAAHLREAETKRISEQDVAQAEESKKDGNAFFSSADYKGAVQAYSHAIELTEGRRDLLADEASATQLRLSALLNRSLCLIRLSRWNDAVKDAQVALLLQPDNAKAYHRLATALIGCHDYAAAKEAVDKLQHYSGAAVSTDVEALRWSIEVGQKQQQSEDKKKFSKLFR